MDRQLASTGGQLIRHDMGCIEMLQAAPVAVGCWAGAAATAREPMQCTAVVYKNST